MLIFATDNSNNNNLNTGGNGEQRHKIMNTTVAKRIDFQKELKAKYNDTTIILFSDMDFYFIYNEDAKSVSEATGIKEVASMDNDFTFMAIPKRRLDTYLPIIIRKGYRVCICDDPVTL